MTLQPEVVYENTEWDAYEHGQGGYGYGYQAEATGPRFAWATDGPCDLRDFVVKQCFISKIAIPEYFLGDVIDVRRIVGSWVETAPPPPPSLPTKAGRPAYLRHGKRQSLNIPLQLQALSLGAFSGQQHRGIDVSTYLFPLFLMCILILMSLLLISSGCSKYFQDHSGLVRQGRPARREHVREPQPTLVLDGRRRRGRTATLVRHRLHRSSPSAPSIGHHDVSFMSSP